MTDWLLGWIASGGGSILIVGAAVAAVIVRLLLWGIERGYMRSGDDTEVGRRQRRPRKSGAGNDSDSAGGEADDAKN